MSRSLPYRATTSSGNQYEFDFPLHPETVAPVKVAQLLGAVLDTLSREIDVLGPVGNGDALQAVAMALAVRTRIVDGDEASLAGLATELLRDALSATVAPAAGNVSDRETKTLH